MGWRRPMAVFAGALLIVVLLYGAEALQRVSPGASSSQPLDSDHIYTLTNVWTIHPTFAPNQWEAMEPKGGGNPFFGAARGGAPGGFGGGSGLGMFGRQLSQAFDTNKDSFVTRAEFTAGFAGLFQRWNSDKSGYLTLAQVRSGIEKDLPPARQGLSPFGGGSGGRRGGPRGPERIRAGAGGRGGGSATVFTGTKDPGLFLSEIVWDEGLLLEGSQWQIPREILFPKTNFPWRATLSHTSTV